MKRNRLGALCLPLLLALGPAEGEEVASFRDLALVSLGQLVQDLGTLHSQGVVEQIAQQSGLDETEVRGKLVELLDELEAHRKGKTDAWKSLVTAGGDEITQKEADKFFKELDKSLRKVLKKGGAYPLAPLVKKASTKAKIQSFQGTDFLVLLLNPGESMPTVELPDKIGLVVVGESKYAINLTAFEPLLITSSDRLNQDKVRNVHKSITKALLSELETSGFVKWAMDKADPKLPPDCRLDFEIEWFSTTPRSGGQAVAVVPASGVGQLGNEDGGRGQQGGVDPNDPPKVYLDARFVMTHLESGVIVFNEAMEFSYDFANESDARVKGTRLLDNFYKKIAQEATRKVNQVLATTGS